MLGAAEGFKGDRQAGMLAAPVIMQLFDAGVVSNRVEYICGGNLR